MGEVARRQSGVPEGADVANITNLSITNVGATIGRPQKPRISITPVFDRKNLFPLSGRAIHAPTINHQPINYNRRGDPRGRPIKLQKFCNLILTAARAVTTLNNKRFNPFKALGEPLNY